ncbi:MAG: iron ABC transporter permease [Candidatus Hydrogenedentes bacterium]|nr:iron ABC transporter permease [Candidatus Hydrogenedentota bacterium]
MTAVSVRRRSDRWDLALLIVTGSILGVTVLYPTIRLVVESISDWQGPALLEGRRPASLWNTAVISLATVLTAGAVGTTLALLIHRYSFPGRRALAALAYLPFTLPPLVGVLSFWYLIGRDGLLPRLLERVFGLDRAFLDGPAAILLIHTYSFYVFFYAMVGAALQSLDYSQIEAARTLGASRARTLFKVTLPLLRSSLIGAALLTLMSSGASFSAPLFFGSDYPMLSVQIYNERSQHRDAIALNLTLVLCVVSMLGLILFRSTSQAAGTASKGVRVPIRSRARRMLGGFLAWSGTVVLLLPHMTILWFSFVDHRRWVTGIIPTTLTLDNYSSLLRDSRNLAPLLNSLWMSALAAIATLVVAAPSAYLVGRGRRGAGWVNWVVMLPWALPGTVVAMNLIVAFNDPWLPLYTTVWMLPLAYFIRNVPLLTRMVTAAVQAFDVSLIEAARTLGANRAHWLRRIVLPLLAPALIAGTAMVFATCLGEFVASILLYLPANIPIAVQINMQWRGSGVGSAFAYSVFLMAMVAITFLVSRRFAARLL